MSRKRLIDGINFLSFDLDGTLYKETPQIREAIRASIYSKVGARLWVDEREARELFEVKFSETNSRRLTLASLLELSEAEASNLLHDWLQEFDIRSYLSRDSGLRELFDTIRKGKILISPSRRFRSVGILQKLGLNELDFNFRTYKDSPEPSDKKSGAVYEYYRDKFGLKSKGSHILHIGNSVTRDIIPAKRKGLRTVFVGGECAESDYSIQEIYDLGNILF